MYVYIYTYVYVYVFVYVDVYIICIYIHTYMCRYIDSQQHDYTFTYSCIPTWIPMKDVDM